MDICCGLRAVAARGKYPGFIILHFTGMGATFRGRDRLLSFTEYTASATLCAQVTEVPFDESIDAFREIATLRPHGILLSLLRMIDISTE